MCEFTDDHLISQLQVSYLSISHSSLQVAMIKVAAPRAVLKVIDCAIQVCGAAGFSDDFPLAQM